jgi:rhodanese-related sulfurtransferase
LTRSGYYVRSLAEQFEATEIHRKVIVYCASGRLRAAMAEQPTLSSFAKGRLAGEIRLRV